MKKLLATVLLMVSMSAHAVVDVNLSGLTETQRAQLVQQAEQMKAEAKTVNVTSMAESVDKWATVGEHFGKMIGGAAKEVGIAVNEFIKTPVGMMTAGLIIFQYIGSPIIHVSVGLLILFTGITLMVWFASRNRRIDIEYDKTQKNILGNYPVLSITKHDMTADTFVTFVFGYIFTFLVSIWVVFSW